MFYDQLAVLCTNKGVTPNKALVDCGISRTAVAKWRKGAIPNGATIQKLADYFGVSTDYLLGTEAQKAPTSEGERKPDMEDVKIALFGGDGEVTDEMWEEAMFAVQLIKDRHKRKKDFNE